MMRENKYQRRSNEATVEKDAFKRSKSKKSLVLNKSMGRTLKNKKSDNFGRESEKSKKDIKFDFKRTIKAQNTEMETLG